MAKTRQQIVAEKAAKYQVPESVLWGVYGVETSHGSNVSTSSAGAKGAFQFIEGTAKQYNYPYTNTQNEQIFAAQADSAAHYLSDLKREHGTWDGALKAYSGGGYGWSQVAAASGERQNAGLFFEFNPLHIPSPFNPLKAPNPLGAGEALVEGVEGLGGVGGAVSSAGSAISGIAEAFGTIEEWLSNPLRIVKLVGGSILVVTGLHTLVRSSGAPQAVQGSIPHKAVKASREAAEAAIAAAA